jgi:hypothetical protein
VTYKQRMIESPKQLSNPVVAGSIPAAPTILSFQSLPVANNNFSMHSKENAMPPSAEFIQEQYKGNMLPTVHELAEVAFEKLQIQGRVEAGESCEVCRTNWSGRKATTFCGDCGRILCAECAEVFAMETYCRECAQEAKRTAAR